MRHSNLFTNRILYLLPLICLALALAVCVPDFHTNTAPAEAQQERPAAAWITPRGADKPFFVIGANYEGPTDRAWMMWEDDKFDPALIEADFARARSLGINTL